MKLESVEMARLFEVSEVPDEDGFYNLGPFENAHPALDLNLEFDRCDIDNELEAVLDHFYGFSQSRIMSDGSIKIIGGGGLRIEITDDDCDDDGNIRIQINGHNVVIPDIREKINTIREESSYHILIDRDLTQYRWVVERSQGKILRGVVYFRSLNPTS